MNRKMRNWPYSKEEYLKKVIKDSNPFPGAEEKFHLQLLIYIGNNCSWMAEMGLIDHHNSGFDCETILFRPEAGLEIYINAVNGGIVETIMLHINQAKSIQ